MSARFDPPTIRQRGQVVQAITAAQGFKPETGEYAGKMKCTRCGSTLRFTITSNGLSRGQCNAANCLRWCQ